MEERTSAAAAAIGLTPEDFESLSSLYNDRFDRLGVCAKTVGWGSTTDQFLRFEVLCRGLDLKGYRILDIGCGLGDFVAWAEERYGPDFDYVGLDLAANLVASASERFTGRHRQFVLGTLGPDSDLGEFDLIVSSGALSFRTSDNMSTMRALLQNAWAKTKGTLSVNFLSSYVDFQLEKNFHYRPEEIFSFSKTLSPWVALHHDYPLYEFTIQILRRPQVASHAP